MRLAAGMLTRADCLQFEKCRSREDDECLWVFFFIQEFMLTEIYCYLGYEYALFDFLSRSANFQAFS